jgi:hypothetical protein
MKKTDIGMVPETPKDKVLYDAFKKALSLGDQVEVNMQLSTGSNVSRAHINKLYKSIRELSMETGNSVEDIKEELKKRTGLIEINQTGDEELVSFKNCSKEQISMMITIVQQWMDFVSNRSFPILGQE